MQAVKERGGPAVCPTVKLAVPAVGVGEPAVDDSHDAFAAPAGFNRPLGGTWPSVSSDSSETNRSGGFHSLAVMAASMPGPNY